MSEKILTQTQQSFSFCEQNASLKLFIDNLPLGAVCYHKMEVVHANSTAFKILKVKKKTVYDLVPPPAPFLHKSYWAYIEQFFFHQGYEFNKKYTERIFTATEKEIIIEFTLISIKLDGFDMQGVVIDDVTKKTMYSEEIKAKQERYADLMNNLHSAVTIFKPVNEGRDFEVIDVNKQLLKKYKIKRTEILGLLSSQIETLGHVFHLNEYIKKVYATEQPVREIPLSFIDERTKKQHYILLNIFKLKKTNEIVLVSHDITQFKESQSKLRESEENFRMLYENISLGVASFTLDGILLNANKAFFQQIKKAELQKKKTLEQSFSTYFNDIETEIFQDFKKVVAVGISLEREYLVHYKQDEKEDEYLWVHFIPLLKRNRVNRVFVILSDITRRKVLEKELIQSKFQAEEADRLKSAFLANMSHEIRTPLNAIVGFTDILANNDLDDEDDKREFATIIKNSSDHLLHVINSILDISKIETGQIKLYEEIFKIKEIIDEVYAMYHPMITKKNVELRKYIEDDDVTIKADKVKLRQILINLLDNAFKYTKSGYIEIGFYIKDDNNIELYVQDTGEGIPDIMQQKIFNQFSQVESTLKPQLRGVGLGLAIVKGYVTKMNGTVSVASVLGEGSTFTVTLPILLQHGRDSKRKKDADEKINVDWTGKTILIVEDYEVNYRYLELMLKDTNVNILYSMTGSNAVTMVNERDDIDLILMDIKLPDIDGFQATRMIKEKHPEIIVIAQTAYALAGDKTKALLKGCDDYISKPIKKKDLYEKIANFFGY